MTILKIAQMGEPVLRQRAREVPPDAIGSPELERLIDDMVDTMRDADGAGLAAPQIYQSLRICVMEITENRRYPSFPPLPLTVLINPLVEAQVPNPDSPAPQDTISLYEGCLSVVGIRGRVRRPRAVKVRALGRNGASLQLQFTGALASVIQHETDHLDGVLFVDRADPRSLSFLREYERYVPVAERIVDWGERIQDAGSG